jgi:hypothetical protein
MPKGRNRKKVPNSSARAIQKMNPAQQLGVTPSTPAKGIGKGAANRAQEAASKKRSNKSKVKSAGKKIGRTASNRAQEIGSLARSKKGNKFQTNQAIKKGY